MHNQTKGGAYKLFTMSLQNIIFYKRIGNIQSILHVIQDLGSDRKRWKKDDLVDKDVLDWSGVFKPWFSNGLYRNLWTYYDIMNLSENSGEVIKNKHQVEQAFGVLNKAK